MPGPGGLQPAEYAAVFRRGGDLSPSRRHGSQRTQRREATSPEPCKWFPAGLGRPRPHARSAEVPEPYTGGGQWA